MELLFRKKIIPLGAFGKLRQPTRTGRVTAFICRPKSLCAGQDGRRVSPDTDRRQGRAGERTERNPMLLFLFVGLLLLRFAVRQLIALLFQLPPRFTRFEPSGHHPKTLQDMPPKRPALRWRHESQQRLHPLLQNQLAPLAAPLRRLIAPELLHKPHLAPPRQPHRAGEQPVAQKIHPEVRPVDGRVALQFQLQFRRQECLYPLADLSQLVSALAPHHKIIHVAHIRPALEFFLEKPVQCRQVKIREMLGGQVANRQAASGRGVIAANNAVEQAQQHRVFKLPCQQAA